MARIILTAVLIYTFRDMLTSISFLSDRQDVFIEIAHTASTKRQWLTLEVHGDTDVNLT